MKRKLAVLAVGVFAALAAGAVLVVSNSDPYHLRAKPRREWKDRAVAEIARRTADPAWVASEIAALKARAAECPADSVGWLSPHLILMKNGDWIAYASICSKEDNRIHDIFVGRGSDGKWYYSTFHFCRGMIVLTMPNDMDGPPENLPKFAVAYHLREFDGHSDECLQKTWPLKRR